MSGDEIDASSLKDANALLIRSVTRVDRNLLDGTPVRFVGTATSGIDHVDVEYLQEAGIQFAHAAGSSSPAVCDYVLAGLFEMAGSESRDLFESTVGIVGVGRIGGLLERRLESLGVKTLLNDPPRADAEAGAGEVPEFISLEDLLSRADIVTLHVPLTDKGPYSTRGLIDRQAFSRMPDGSWIVNTSRGEVIDEDGLADQIESGRMSAVLDVWDAEPDPNCRLVQAASISTPHIAGYALESKQRAIQSVAGELAAWADASLGTPELPRPQHLPISVPPEDRLDVDFCSEVIKQAYDIGRDHLRMQALCSLPEDQRAEFFRELRDGYRMRNEFTSFTVDEAQLDDRRADLVRAIGMSVN